MERFPLIAMAKTKVAHIQKGPAEKAPRRHREEMRPWLLDAFRIVSHRPLLRQTGKRKRNLDVINTHLMGLFTIKRSKHNSEIRCLKSKGKK